MKRVSSDGCQWYLLQCKDEFRWFNTDCSRCEHVLVFPRDQRGLLLLGFPNLLVRNIYHVKNEGCLLEVFIMRLFNRTLSMYGRFSENPSPNPKFIKIQRLVCTKALRWYMWMSSVALPWEQCGAQLCPRWSWSSGLRTWRRVRLPHCDSWPAKQNKWDIRKWRHTATISTFDAVWSKGILLNLIPHPGVTKDKCLHLF